MEASRRLQKGLGFNSTYTFAKNLADNEGTNPTSFAEETGGRATYLATPAVDNGNVYGTRRHRWITTGSYELPVGRGRMFGSHMNRLEDAVAGGWQLSSIFLWQTGPFLTAYIPSSDADPSGTGSGILYGRSQRPDLVGKIVPAHQSKTEWINPNAFACPSNTGYTTNSYAGEPCGVGVTSSPIGRFGNAGVGDIVGPGTVNLSAGLKKRFVLTERVHMQAEGTFTNVLNHLNLNDPNLNTTSPAFGTITSARGSDFGGNRTGQVAIRLEF